MLFLRSELQCFEVLSESNLVKIWRSLGCAFFVSKLFVFEKEFMGEEAGKGKDRKPAVGFPTAKRLGEAVEAVFLAKATMLGFPVLKPWGDSRPYDFAVESGRRLWRVQVKCATGHRGTRCEARAAGSGELYTLNDLDFLAAYVIEKDMWYVVPAEAFVPRATVHFNYGPRSQGMFEIYREAWCLLALSARPRSCGAIPRRCRCTEMTQRCDVCPRR